MNISTSKNLLAKITKMNRQSLTISGTKTAQDTEPFHLRSISTKWWRWLTEHWVARVTS